MTTRWIFAEDVDESAVEQLSGEINVNPTIAKILLQRDILDFEQAKTFFRPSLDQLHDPFLMQDMEKAVERIGEAISDDQKILVYGDYDVDGTTSVALIYLFLQEIHENIDFYIPDRYHEGYGVSEKGIEYARENKVDLIIALDCGIKAIEKVQYAKDHGIDFIICDHHNPGDEIPPAVAVLDPKRSDCNYPYKELSGCGVGFKLAQGYAQRNGIPFEEKMSELSAELYEQFAKADQLEATIKKNLEVLGYGE